MTKLNPYRSVLGERRFFAANGEVYASLQELAHGLAKMDLHTFSHHVTLEKNDFASWLRDVFAEHELARNMAASKSPHSMVLKLQRRLGFG